MRYDVVNAGGAGYAIRPGTMLYFEAVMPLRVREVLLDLAGDEGCDRPAVGVGEDGRWFMDRGGDAEVFFTPRLLAARLWNGGTPGAEGLRALSALNWLSVDVAAVGRAPRDAVVPGGAREAETPGSES